MDQAHYFTKGGIDKFQLRLKQLEDDLCKIQAQSADAAEVGGNQYHDNASYEYLVIQLRGLDRQVADAYRILRHAQIVEPPKDTHHVAIGCWVAYLLNGQKRNSLLVGYGESDTNNHYLAYNTPLGRLLIGTEIGEKKKGVIGIKKIAIEVLSISMKEE